MACFDEFCKTPAEQLITGIHLEQTRLVPAKCVIEVVHRLRRARTDGNQRRRIVQRSDRNRIMLALDLRGKEANTACHLFYATDFPDEGALEGVYVGIELRSQDGESEREKVGERREKTDVLELDITKFSKLIHSIMSNLGWDEELDEAHGLRT